MNEINTINETNTITTSNTGKEPNLTFGSVPLGLIAKVEPSSNLYLRTSISPNTSRFILCANKLKAILSIRTEFI